MTASTRLLVAFVCAIAAGGVVLMIGQAFTPQRPRQQARRRIGIDTTWVTAAAITFVIVLAITRWPIAAIEARWSSRSTEVSWETWPALRQRSWRPWPVSRPCRRRHRP